MMRFTLVVLLIAAVEAATECPPGTTGPDGFTTFRLVPLQLRGGSDCAGCCTCHQIAEFRFKDMQGNQIAPVSVTNPGGYNNIGQEPIKLIDLDIYSKFLDANTQPVEFAFSSGVSVISYEWVTSGDATATDMISWRLEGKNFATDAAWTTVHTVSNYGTTQSRSSVVGPFFFNVCMCNPGHTGPDGGPCSPCVSGTYKDSYG
jgi:hypothetical protein